MQHDSSPKVPAGRIQIIDIARGAALVAMTIYHFAWDLENFGWLLSGTMREAGWVYFARSIAASFLYLVGVSLVLAHAEKIHWRGFSKRLTQLVAAATIITIATYFAVPESYIFFGILHAIAVFSLIGLLFVRLAWWFSAVTALAVLLLWHFYSAEVFAESYLRWIGLAPTPPRSNDYVPLFPWFAAVLFGIAFSKIATRLNLWVPFTNITLPGFIQKPLTFIGRHSLIYYLVHQPVMIALLWLFTTFIVQPDKTEAFNLNCSTQCQVTQSAQFCSDYCACVVTELKRENLFEVYTQSKMTEEQEESVLTMRDQCIAKQK